jgi:hypothetical protein
VETYVVVVPDYQGIQHHVFGPFDDPMKADRWGRENIGTSRAWFAAPIKATEHGLRSDG